MLVGIIALPKSSLPMSRGRLIAAFSKILLIFPVINPRLVLGLDVIVSIWASVSAQSICKVACLDSLNPTILSSSNWDWTLFIASQVSDDKGATKNPTKSAVAA